MAVLRVLRSLPLPVSRTLLRPGLGIYRALRPGHVKRIRACFDASPFAGSLTLEGYYQRRLDLLLAGLRLHGRPVPEGAVRAEGREYYREALASGRPVALIGLHAGLLELLHRIPEAPPGRPFHILTAPAFSPALTAFLAEGRERDGKRVLWIGRGGKVGMQGEFQEGGTRGLVHGIRTVAAGGGVLALMVDQHPGAEGEDGVVRLWDRVRVPYPGRLLRHLAGRGFALVPVSTWVREEGVSFRFHPAWKVSSDRFVSGTDMDTLVRSFLEEAVSAAPEQWNWSYRGINPA